MPFNPNNDRSIAKLRQSFIWSRKQLRPYRDLRVEAIKEYLGGSNRTAMNVLEIAVSTYIRHLVARCAKVMVTTPYMQLKPSASTLELAENHLLQEIKFVDTQQEVALDAMFGMGIFKVGETPAGSVEINGELYDVGQPFAERVSLDDWVHDVNAKDWRACGYMGNRYRVPYEWVMTNPSFMNTKGLMPMSGEAIERHGEEGEDSERAEDIAREQNVMETGEFQPMIELWDLYLPQDKLMMTLPAQVGRMPVQVIEWDGPEGGPYHPLVFTRVPDSIMPLPPTKMWLDIHILINKIFRKLAQQSERQKDIGLIPMGDQGDAERLNATKDGDWAVLANPGAAQTESIGGPNQTNVAFLVHLIDRFDWLAGNLSALGGLGVQAETLGQEELLSDAASQRVKDYQDSVVRAIEHVLGASGLAWWLWYDPLIDITTTQRINVLGNEIDIPTRFNETSKEGDFLQYNFTVSPHSTAPMTPDQQLAKLTTFIQNVHMPLQQVAAEQGVQLDIEGLYRRWAKLANMPELEEFIFVGQPHAPETPTEPGQTAPKTTREYVRRNVAAGTSHGKAGALMATLLGQGVQNAEMGRVGSQQ